MMLSETEWWVALGVVALMAIALIALFAARASRRRHDQLRRRFGPEYEREVEQHGSVSRAERELVAREKRVEKQRLQPLSEEDRMRFSADWHEVQARFVDHPSGAVQSADELIKAVMLAKGYEMESFEQRVADLSVEHAHVVQHYRAAQLLAEANREGRANTEELRQAMVHYRALFADLLVDQAYAPETRFEPPHAVPSRDPRDPMAPR